MYNENQFFQIFMLYTHGVLQKNFKPDKYYIHTVLLTVAIYIHSSSN